MLSAVLLHVGVVRGDSLFEPKTLLFCHVALFPYAALCVFSAVLLDVCGWRGEWEDDRKRLLFCVVEVRGF